MAVGPCELLIVKFPGNRFRGEIAPAIADLVRTGTVTIIDLVFAIKDEAGDLSIVEITDIDGDGVPDLVAASGINHVITDDDIDDAEAVLEPNSSALLILFEHTWALKVSQAMRNADGEVVYQERIPAAVVEEVLASVPQA